ncbi:cysteine desulfurase-like protein [Enterovibrio nigricans]|uniref:Cysteine desulfurase family protein, VC1184 subfamily n=1 Tax=Enterovibrio nigricans DSM 22720 TaxID=1121868 RepID=A0A1T4VJS7_9GAMM|nr:cysteine desulfurase-like protein [Enterovibrio nigricans]SKA65212.1 cysteine desulfurase family protein, VC1184 subfamily [Enterovibrio nigricans DSM 22720]
MAKCFPLTSENVEVIRSLFPALQRKIEGDSPIYLDGPGGTQSPESVILAISDYLRGGNSNLGGRFLVSQETEVIVAKAREGIAALLGASKDEVFFGANMTSVTFALSRALCKEWQPGDEVIVTEADHGANRSSWIMAAQDRGVTVHYLPIVDQQGSLDLDKLDSLLNKRARLVAITAASNITGNKTDLETVIEKCRKVNCKVFVDAVHLLPHQLVDVKALDVDFLACSAYKFYGPHLGIMYGKAEWLASLTPYKVAPAPDVVPKCWETGTLNFEALSGVVATIDYLASLGEGDSLRARLVSAYDNIHCYEKELAEYFLQKLKDVGSAELYGLDSVEGRTATFALRFGDRDPAEIAEALGQRQIYVWSGHLYADRLTDAFGVTDKGGILRVGLMHYNTKAEIDTFFDVLGRIL